MKQKQNVFCRKELKYLLDESQYAAIQQKLREQLCPDEFYKSTISNIYYDMPNHLLIRRSIAKQTYKEKLRIRCYQVPDANTEAFIEIKRKVSGLVYKRRASLPYAQAAAYLSGTAAGGESQIFHEIDWLLNFYRELTPAMFLSCSRVSFKGKEDENLRITFDRDILWRTQQLDLTAGNWGNALLTPGQRLMEVKVPSTMPLWLTEMLSAQHLYPVSFSKYGNAFQAWQCGAQHQTGGKKYA